MSGSGRCAPEEALREEATAWLVRLRAEDAGEAERRAFGEWLEGRPDRRAAFEEVEALWAELGRARDPRARERRPDLAASAEPGRPRLPARPARRSFRAAALLALTAAALLWAVGPPDAWAADHATGVGETALARLPDGSRARLATNTALAVEFGVERRRVRLLRGEAFFEVDPRGERPFEVAAGGGVARAVGTAFDVRRAEEGVTVAVLEGTVRVRTADAPPGSSAALTIGRGDAARYAPGGALARRELDVEAHTAWREGKLVFSGRPLREVLTELDRYRPGAIVLLGSGVAEERFTGVFDLHDTDAALEAVERTLPVKAHRLTPYLVVLRPEG